MKSSILARIVMGCMFLWLASPAQAALLQINWGSYVFEVDSSPTALIANGLVVQHAILPGTATGPSGSFTGTFNYALPNLGTIVFIQPDTGSLFADYQDPTLVLYGPNYELMPQQLTLYYGSTLTMTAVETVVETPEPASFALLASGLVVGAIRRWRGGSRRAA